MKKYSSANHGFLKPEKKGTGTSATAIAAPPSNEPFPPISELPGGSLTKPPIHEPPPQKNPTPKKTPPYVPPRPIARGRWNVSQANFGDLDYIWQSMDEGSRRELSGFPQDAVKDFFYLLDMAKKNQTSTGKNGMVVVNGNLMDTIDAANYVMAQMRTEAAQRDAAYRQQMQNLIQWRENQKLKKRQNATTIANTPRIMPQTFGG